MTRWWRRPGSYIAFWKYPAGGQAYLVLHPSQVSRAVTISSAPVMPRYWLLKTEPGAYSFDQLRSGRHDAVDRRAQLSSAQQHDGDAASAISGLFYHSSVPQPAAVGICEVVKEAYPDFTQFDRASDYFDGRAKPDKPIWFMVDVAFEKAFAHPVTLAQHARRTAARGDGAYCAAASGFRFSRSCRTSGRSCFELSKKPVYTESLRLREKDALRVDRHLARCPARSRTYAPSLAQLAALDVVGEQDRTGSARPASRPSPGREPAPPARRAGRGCGPSNRRSRCASPARRRFRRRRCASARESARRCCARGCSRSPPERRAAARTCRARADRSGRPPARRDRARERRRLR